MKVVCGALALCFLMFCLISDEAVQNVLKARAYARQTAERLAEMISDDGKIAQSDPHRW